MRKNQIITRAEFDVRRGAAFAVLAENQRLGEARLEILIEPVNGQGYWVRAFTEFEGEKAEMVDEELRTSYLGAVHCAAELLQAEFIH